MNFIDLKSQYERIRTPMNERIQKVLDHGQYIMGPEVVELEQRLAQFVGAKHCIAASSGEARIERAPSARGPYSMRP